MTKRTLIIAEAGVNHGGDLDCALALVDAAARAGADIIKFQTFSAAKLASPLAVQAAYQVRNTGVRESQLEMLRRLELSEDAHLRIIERCAAHGLGFLSSPFDLDSLDFLVSRCGLAQVKMGSGEITNAPLLLAAAERGLSVILSTGMSTLGEVEEALGVLAYGYLRRLSGVTSDPSRHAFTASWQSPAARHLVQERVILLHCTTDYPAPYDEVNLRAMDTLHNAFGLDVGYSDHTEGIALAVAAVARGARVIEKHFTLDRDLPGPDHKASLEPDEFAALVVAVRQVEAALGDGIKTPRGVEISNIPVARKSLIAARDIAAGDILSGSDILIMRPGHGRSPMRYWETLGTRAERAYHAGEPLDP